MSANRRQRSVWAMRVMALLFPLLVLAVIEISFRLAGVYKDDVWANPYVSFDRDAIPFPGWDKTIRKPKPKGIVRIVALGGSCTQGLGVEEPFALLVQRRLSQYWPQRRIEVINGGASAIGSHRVFEVLKRAAEFDVDIAIVYFGHNEFLEDIYFDPNGFAAHAERLGTFARQFRVLNWLRSLAPGILSAYKPRVQRHFLGNSHFPLIRTREQYEARLKFFESNVRQMIAFARAHKIQILFMPAVPNLLCPPGDSVHGPGYAANTVIWEELFSQSISMLNRANGDDADQAPLDASGRSALTSGLDKLCSLDDQYAMSHYLRGLAYLRMGNPETGLEALLAANLRDRRGDRSNSELINVLLRVCAQENVPCIDVRNQFYARVPAEFRRMMRKEKLALFWDHCHPTSEGHKIIAEAFSQSLMSQVQ